MARGLAIFALEHSSLRWNGASYLIPRESMYCIGFNKRLPAHGPDNGEKSHHKRKSRGQLDQRRACMSGNENEPVRPFSSVDDTTPYIGVWIGFWCID